MRVVDWIGPRHQYEIKSGALFHSVPALGSGDPMRGEEQMEEVETYVP